MRRKLGLSTAQVRKILRREAPRTEALTRALPLAGVADEVPRLTSYLASTIGLSEEELEATLEQEFPRISQTLTALRNTADGWYDVPGIEGLTRVSREKPVRTVPGLRKYLRDDLVPRIVEHDEEVRGLAGVGDVAYLPYVLLVIGLGVAAFGVIAARRAVQEPPGYLAWGIVASVGFAIVVLLVATQYFPRLTGAQDAADAFEPVLTEPRVRGLAGGIDTLHDAIAFADPIATRRGGGTREARALYRFVAERTAGNVDEVRAALRRRAPRTQALLTAIPLTAVSREIPRLRRYLARALRLPGDRLDAALRRRAPGLTHALLTMLAVTTGWNAIPATERMTRFDGVTPVRSLAALDEYLRGDLVPVLVARRGDFETFAGRWPPLDVFPPLLFVIAIVTILYAGVMGQFFGRRD